MVHPGRRADEPRHSVLFHVFRHVETDQPAGILEEKARELPRDLGLTDTRGPKKYERSDGPVGAGDPEPAAADGPGHSLYGIVLADHAMAQDLLHPLQSLRLVLANGADRNARPRRHHILDVSVVHHHTFGGLLGVGRRECGEGQGGKDERQPQRTRGEVFQHGEALVGGDESACELADPSAAPGRGEPVGLQVRNDQSLGHEPDERDGRQQDGRTPAEGLARVLPLLDLERVRSRFKNRPDEPMWHYVDSVVSGNQGDALRRLADFLQHGHPLQLLAFLQSDVRRRAMAAAAPDYDSFVEWDGGRAGWALEKVWKQRSRVKRSDLKLALSALARADLQMKTAPEATHRVTMERLTVAMCRWYGGARRR